VKHSFKASGTTQQTMQPYIPEDFNIPYKTTNVMH